MSNPNLSGQLDYKTELGMERAAIQERVGEALSFAAGIAGDIRDRFGVSWDAGKEVTLPVVRGGVYGVHLVGTSYLVPRQFGYGLTLCRSLGFSGSDTYQKLEQPDSVRLWHQPLAIEIPKFDDEYQPEPVVTVSGSRTSVYRNIFISRKLCGFVFPDFDARENDSVEAFFAYDDRLLDEGAVQKFGSLTTSVEDTLDTVDTYLRNQEINPLP